MSAWRLVACALLSLSFAGTPAHADSLPPSPTTVTTTNAAAELLARVLAQRPRSDLELHGRLWNAREEATPVTVRARHAEGETRTVYRTEQVELLVIRPQHGMARLFLRGVGELRGAARWTTFPGTSIACADFALDFLQWDVEPTVGQERVRGRDCHRIELIAPTPDEPYRRARVWIDREYLAVLRAELMDADDRVARRMAVTSFRRVEDVWIPRQIEIAHIPRGQALPSQERSRLEILGGNFQANLPAEWFDETRF